MLFFHNGSDTITITGKKITSNISLNTEKMSSSYLISMPSLNIHFYTRTEEEIEASAHQSMESFLRFWMNIQGLEKFTLHLHQLGFRLLDKRPIKLTNTQTKSSKMIKDKLVLDY